MGRRQDGSYHAVAPFSLFTVRFPGMDSRTHMASIVLLAVAGILVASCSGMPVSTRTGVVKTIVIEESQPEPHIWVHKGDEVRWLNQRQGTIGITFLDSLEGKVNCQRGFGLLDVINAIQVKAQDSVSLCFSELGPLHYTLRLDHFLPTGQLHIRGTITVQESFDSEG